MSEATPINDPAALEVTDPQVVMKALALIERLASLKAGPFSHLAEAPMDAMLTTKQAAVWLQLSPREINLKANAGIIPAVRLKNSIFRFHPRSIIEKAETIYAKKKRIKNL